jgi:hypothetical protein
MLLIAWRTHPTQESVTYFICHGNEAGKRKKQRLLVKTEQNKAREGVSASSSKGFRRRKGGRVRVAVRTGVEEAKVRKDGGSADQIAGA